MNESAKIIAAAVFLTCPSALAWAQQTQSAPPVMEFAHRGVFPGAPPAAPAMSLKDVPPHPAELSGRVPKLTHIGPNGNVAHIMPTAQGAAARHAASLAGPAAISTPALLYRPHNK
jgi:hypothetical protein